MIEFYANKFEEMSLHLMYLKDFVQNIPINQN